ncbi:glutamine amidotransferase [Alkalibaculum sp. M08DMB]|uniref:Glutamine amidotransferase n=1 Tax=Alkalibaculum sporogenes TaxID=2655001 RepID=A0A6A7KBN8_9FIRM|nr:glutamine amidotransferase [Alkalibaculum sporogenes]MPW26765.1 glutamine amidotransferase [Alkalibaculum sporogenes]
MSKLLIIKTGVSNKSVVKKCGDCDFRIARYAGVTMEDVIVASVYENIIPSSIEGVSSIIITGSPSMVTDSEPWSIATSRWLKSIVQKQIPILGICFGHQLLAQTLGGKVDYHELGEESGKVEIQLTNEGRRDPLLGILPSNFSAYVSHSQTVTKLPKNARVLAKNNFESNHAVSFGNKVWGVQFHPEYPDAPLCESINENSYGGILLRRFLQLAG